MSRAFWRGGRVALDLPLEVEVDIFGLGLLMFGSKTNVIYRSPRLPITSMNDRVYVSSTCYVVLQGPVCSCQHPLKWRLTNLISSTYATSSSFDGRVARIRGTIGIVPRKSSHSEDRA